MGFKLVALILSFACYDIIKISREFSELSEDYRARVASVVYFAIAFADSFKP